MTAARIPETTIVVRIAVKSDAVKDFRISFIAAAEPERDLSIAKRVTKLKPMIIVFVAPTMNRKPLESWGITSLPMVAACPEPMPGRKAQRGEEIKTAPRDLRNSFLDILIFFNGWTCCFGIFDFVLRLIMSAESPKSPLSRGINGCFTGRLNERKPRNPVKRKTTVERMKFSSLKMR